MTIRYLYLITWPDGVTEAYRYASNRSARVATLEDMGYQPGEDFTLHTVIDDD